MAATLALPNRCASTTPPALCRYVVWFLAIESGYSLEALDDSIVAGSLLSGP